MPPSTPQRTINANILLYGPKDAGKSSNLRFIQRKLKPEQRGEIEVRHQDGVPGVTYEYLPIQLGPLMGYETNLFIYTAPDGDAALETRLSLLPDAAGVAFIAHSSARQMDANRASLASLKDELRYFGIEWETFPVLVQYNHRDARDALPIDELERELNPEGHQSFEAVANAGEGVRATFAAIAKLAVRRVRLQLMKDHSEGGADARGALSLADEASMSEEPPPVLNVPPVRAAATRATGRSGEAPTGERADDSADVDARTRAAPKDKESAQVTTKGSGSGSDKGSRDDSRRGEAEPKADAGPRVNRRVAQEPEVDPETSGEFRQPGEDFYKTRLAGFGADEPMTVEAIEASDEGDDDDGNDEDLSLPPTPLTPEERTRLKRVSLTDADEGALTLAAIPEFESIPIPSMSSAGGGDVQIHTYDEEEEDEDPFNLHIGASSNLDLADIRIEDEPAEDLSADVLDLDEMGLEAAGEEVALDDGLDLEPAAEVEEEALDEPAEEAFTPPPAGDEDLTDDEMTVEAERSQVDALESLQEEPLASHDDALYDEPVGVAPPAPSFVDEDEDDEAGPATVAVTAIPALQEATPEDLAVAASPTPPQAVIAGWGEPVRIDARSIVLPVVVEVPGVALPIDLHVTLHVDQLLPAGD